MTVGSFRICALRVPIGGLTRVRMVNTDTASPVTPAWTHGHDYANWLRQKGYILRQFTRDAEGMPPEVHETTWCVEKTIWNSRRNWTLSICSQSFQSKSRYSQSWMFEVLYWSYIVTAGGGVLRHLPDAGLANEAWLVEMLVLTGHQDTWDIHSATEHKRA